jgi:uncharacterized membrane protein
LNERGWKIAVVVSLVLNLFLIGAVAGGAVVAWRAMAERSPDRGEAGRALGAAARELPPADRRALRRSVRDAAFDARTDLRKARDLRGEAVRLASAETFDRQAVEALLAEARAAELRGRVRVEQGVLDALEEMDAGSRETVAPMLARGRVGAAGRNRAPPPPQGEVAGPEG